MDEAHWSTRSGTVSYCIIMYHPTFLKSGSPRFMIQSAAPPPAQEAGSGNTTLHMAVLNWQNLMIRVAGQLVQGSHLEITWRWNGGSTHQCYGCSPPSADQNHRYGLDIQQGQFCRFGGTIFNHFIPTLCATVPFPRWGHPRGQSFSQHCQLCWWNSADVGCECRLRHQGCRSSTEFSAIYGKHTKWRWVKTNCSP